MEVTKTTYRLEGTRIVTKTMNHFIKRPLMIQAMQWLGGNYECLNDFCGENWRRADAIGHAGPDDAENVVIWNVKEKQWLNLPLNFWIIRGIEGELYPCDPEIFNITYEPA